MSRRPPRRSGRRRARRPSATPTAREAVLYARVSSREQEREGFSIAAQKRLLTEYATREGLVIVEEFVDVETAKTSGRTEFTRMLGYLRRRAEKPVLLVEKTDRLYRNLRDWVSLDDLRVDVHLVKEGLQLSEESRSSEKFVHGIKVLMAKNYVENLSEEVRKGMRQKALQGYWPSAAPVGYVNQRSNGRSLIVPDPERAAFVQAAFELYDTGNHSIADISKWAQAHGYTGRRGGKIGTALVHTVLRNPIYSGRFFWGGVEYEGQDPRLISPELFERVQARLDGFAYTRESKHSFAYTGLISCGHCGGAVTAELKKKKYVYYHCATRCQREKFVREEKLAQMLHEATRVLQMPQDLREATIAVLKASRRTIAEETEQRAAEVRQRYDRLGRLIDAAYEDKLEGRIDHAFFEAKKAEWDQQRTALRLQIDRLDSANSANLDKGIELFELSNSAYNLLSEQEDAERRRLYDLLLSNCSLANGELTVEWRKPFCYLSSWRKDPYVKNPSSREAGGVHSEWSG